jgi:hypothetical protein
MKILEPEAGLSMPWMSSARMSLSASTSAGQAARDRYASPEVRLSPMHGGVVQGAAAQPPHRRRLADRDAGRPCARENRSLAALSTGSVLAHELDPLHERLVEILKLRPSCLSTRRAVPCSIRAVAAPRPVTSGLSRAMIDHEAVVTAVAYLYAPGRDAEHACVASPASKGMLQVDGYAAPMMH